MVKTATEETIDHSLDQTAEGFPVGAPRTSADPGVSAAKDEMRAEIDARKVQVHDQAVCLTALADAVLERFEGLDSRAQNMTESMKMKWAAKEAAKMALGIQPEGDK